MVLFVLALVVAAVAAVRGMWSPCGLSMLTSLNPVSETTRHNRFVLTAVWYVAGALVGGAALGTGAALAASGVGRLHPGGAALWSCVLAASLVGVASDTRVVGRSLPDHPRQVDERWLVRYRRWIYASGYGLQIGAGFATYIMTAAVYLAVALAVLTGSAAQAFTICLTFGGARGLTILVASQARTAERLRDAHRRIAALAAPSLWVAIAVQAGVAAVAALMLAGPLLSVGVVAAVALAWSIARPRPVSS